MEALYFLKFWKSSVLNRDHHRPSSVVDTDYEFFEEEEDDSFFELELTVPDFDSSNCKNNSPLDIESNRFDIKFQNPQLEKTPPVSLSSTDSVSKRKILPIEPNSSSSKPQSPISILKSSPRFRVLMFKKSKSMAAQKTGEKTEQKTGDKKEERKVFSVKFKLKEVANVPIFTRDNSLRRRISEDSLSDESSKIFSKEAMQKYLKLIKPLYVRVSRKRSDKTDLSGVSPSSSPATVTSGSPKKDKQGSIPAGIRVVCKHLGKSKSASSAAINVPAPAPVGRRDDSLVLQQDGIQSAILHCKKSFNSASCRDSSLLSRFASDDIPMASPRTSLQEERGSMN